MQEEVPDRPFLWSEIHSLANESLAELEKTIREEINANISPPPKSGGARHQFFVLLGERADAWAARAKDAYQKCLAQIGRKSSPAVEYAIWFNGLRFFIAENLRQLMYLNCAMGPEKQRLIGLRFKKYAPQKDVLEAEGTARDIERIVERISKRYEAESSRQDWFEELNKLIAEIGGQRQPQQAPGILPSIGRSENPLLQARDSLVTRNIEPHRKLTDSAEQETSTDERFSVSEDFRSVSFHGKDYQLTRSQSIQLKILFQAHRSPHPGVDKDKLLSAIESETSSVRNIWKRSPLWQKLIFSPRKGIYQLKLPRPVDSDSVLGP